jgi:hypothetical protein
MLMPCRRPGLLQGFVATGTIAETCSGGAFERSFREPGQENVLEGKRPEAIGGFLPGELLLPARRAEEALAPLAAEGPGGAHPPHEAVAGVGRRRALRRQRARGRPVDGGRRSVRA